MRGLIFDPFAGISGDMILGALVDAGVRAEWLAGFVDSLGLGEIRVRVDRVDRSGISCARVRFELPEEHEHRHLEDVLAVVDGSGAPAEARRRAESAFRRLAEAEAAVHGIDVDRVHFHEVGALDAILDVLCAMASVDELGIERCYTRPVAVGTGAVEIEHGRFPVPAPATVKLLEGLPVRATGYTSECTTPTGAAILATLVEDRGVPDPVIARASGYGAGARDPEGRPNCLRVIRCDVPDDAADRLYVVQADLDDLPPEYAVPAQDAVFQAGALDVVTSPVAMKKGRPGLRFEALVREAALEPVLNALFRTTSTIGARYWPVVRPALPREDDVLEWRGQRIRRKRVVLPDGRSRTKPEYDDVVRAATALGLAPYEVRLALEHPEQTPPDAAD